MSGLDVEQLVQAVGPAAQLKGRVRAATPHRSHVFEVERALLDPLTGDVVLELREVDGPEQRGDHDVLATPHSRACGARTHPHGESCAADCPTCQYACPQCGPDPRGADIHARDRHTL